MIEAIKVVISSILLILVTPIVVIRFSFKGPELIPVLLSQAIDLLTCPVEYVDEDGNPLE